MTKRTVEFEGKIYKLRCNACDVPHFPTMSRLEVLMWLIRETYPRGYHKAPNPLAGYAGTISLA